MPPKKRAAATAEDKNGDGAVKPAKLNKTSSDFSSIDFDNSSRTKDGDRQWNFKVVSWNVDGLRAWIKKGGLDLFRHEDPDVICLQETKCSDAKLPDEIKVQYRYYEY